MKYLSIPTISPVLKCPDTARRVIAKKPVVTTFVAVVLGSLLALPAGVRAQQTPQDPSSATDQKALPDPPKAVQPAPAQPSANDEERLPQTKRILGIIPNFRSVSTDERLPPQSVKEKFMDATEDSFDYSSIVIPGVIAGYSMAKNSYPEFHQGAAGYARYFWHSAVDQTSENYMVEFIVPTITREDTRYYTLGRGGFLKRTGYALSRIAVTRNDAQNETFNVSEVFGAGASSGISSLYYPGRERTFGNVGTEWGLDLAIDAASFEVREFWPDINRHIFHSKDSMDSSER
jgi:hypothetical protein